MSTPTNDITVSTLQIVREEAVDQLFRTTPFLSWAERTGAIKLVTGGKSISHPTALNEHASIVNLGGGGYGSVTYNVTDPLVSADFNWCNAASHVVMTKVEEMANRGPEAKVDLLSVRLKNVLGLMAREFEKQVFAKTSTSLTDLESFNGIDAATGWFEELAFGSQTNSVGGIAKSSYTTAWQHQLGDASGAFATNGLREMSDIVIGSMTYVENGEIDGIFASPISFGLYKDQLSSQERYMATDKLIDGGRLSLAYHGAPMMISQHLGFTGSGGSNKLSMLFLNSKSLVVYFDKDGKFELLPVEPISGAVAHKQDVFMRAQVAASHLASMGALINAEA